jgi:hypothetical protein
MIPYRRYHAVDLLDFDLARLARTTTRDPSLGLKRLNWVAVTYNIKGIVGLYGLIMICDSTILR